MAVFLSYSTEDQDAALEIATWFDQHGIEIHYWSDVERQSGQIVHRLESQIYESNAFIALVSPDYFASGWCRRERDLAFIIETEGQEHDLDYAFVYVLQVSGKDHERPGFLRGYFWFDATSPQKRKETLDHLIHRFTSSRKAPTMKHSATAVSPGSSPFINRRLELATVIEGLTQPGGPHFWLVISPPGLGKSWFLNRLSIELEHPESDGSEGRGFPWTTRLVDVRDQSRAARQKPGLVLASLFGLAPGATVDARTLEQIAQQIVEGDQPYLCLLDSAELLEDKTVVSLRSSLGEVYEIVKRSGKPTARLAFVVASRHDQGWLGVAPTPRLRRLVLSEFDEDVVTGALETLAQEMNRSFRSSELARFGVLLHRLTEGLPGLLLRGLQWIRTEEWRDVERLASHEVFEELVHTYVEKGLLSTGTLFPWREPHVEGRQQLLEEVFWVLSRYRLFTQSHLREMFEHNPDLQQALGDVHWSIEDLWNVLDRTPLLSRPLDEPWHEIHPAIRRLLFRYHYRSDDDKRQAHRQARAFVEVWTGRQQAAREQVVGMVECVWHEASGLVLDRPEALKGHLVAFAGSLSRTLRPSAPYSMAELREEAAERVREDRELQEVVDTVPGLLEQLLDVISSPTREGGG